METKRCSCCKIIQPIDNFYPYMKNDKIYRFGNCDVCRNKRNAHYKKQNKEKTNANAKKGWKRLREDPERYAKYYKQYINNFNKKVKDPITDAYILSCITNLSEKDFYLKNPEFFEVRRQIIKLKRLFKQTKG